MRDQDEVTGVIIDVALQMHRDLGPGLLETVYEAILARALDRRGLRVERQKVIRFEYQGMVFEDGFRVDLVVDDRVIVEVKSVEQIGRHHWKQLLTYLKLTNTPVGLLINFGAPTLREGLRRIVNGFQPSASPRLRVNQGEPANQEQQGSYSNRVKSPTRNPRDPDQMTPFVSRVRQSLATDCSSKPPATIEWE